MKKKTLGLIVIVFVAMMFTIFTLWRVATKPINAGNLADIEWYSVTGKEFTITTADELYDLVALSDFYDFEGQTIKLGADIIINEGNSEDWAEKAPKIRWNPITGFAGTFDGQGHTISGLYGKTADNGMGLFNDTTKDCVIQNFSLKNSYFYTTGRKGTGSIVGEGAGTFKRIYSDAIIASDNGSSYNAGFIGIINQKASMDECWFDGAIHVDDANNAGFVSCIQDNATINMTNCLNSGDIECLVKNLGIRTGGFVGSFKENESNRVFIKDSLNVGKITASDPGTAYTGSLIGRVDGGAVANIRNTYATKEAFGKAVGATAGTQSGTAMLYAEEKIVGYGAYQWMNLDFEKYWAVDMEGTPILKYFADEVPDLSDIVRKFNTDWYDEKKTEYVIHTMEDFYGMALLTYETDFTGKTVKLDADITLNTGNASEWGEKVPELEFMKTSNFAGRFDGQNHTISGIYLKESNSRGGLFAETSGTAVIENLKLLNSYIEGGEGTGSIVGRANGGTYRNIYSDAYVHGNKHHVGGIVGALLTSGRISNCWYAGELYSWGFYSGGISGSIMANTGGTIEHCLNTGTIVTDGTGNRQSGGIVGLVSGTGTINDNLNAGVMKAHEKGKKIGSVIGNASGGAKKITVEASYGITEGIDIGIGGGSIYGYTPVYSKSELQGNGGYQRTRLNFETYWAISKNGTPVLKTFEDTKVALPNVVRPIQADISWYDETKTNFTIKTPEQLLGFAYISAKDDFAGKTVNLGANIVFNNGDAATWENQSPLNHWPDSVKMAGTFNGKGYSISGLYNDCGKGEKWLGLFASTEKTSVVKNLSLKNSFFKAESTSRVGGIAGVGYGVFDTIYCDAILVSGGTGIGGIVGATDEVTILNCWYDGKLNATANGNAYAGGILGFVNNGKATVMHCLNSGTIYSNADKTKGPRVGGIIGSVDGGKKTNAIVTDCFNTGMIHTNGATSQVAAIVGRQTAPNKESTPLILTNSYSVAGKVPSYDNTHQNSGEITLDNVKLIKEELITGIGAYQRMNLDFKQYWSVRKESIPILTSFAQSGEILSLAGVNVERASDFVKDTSWYTHAKGTNEVPYLIKDAADLYGFALLVNEGNTFEGKTIKLISDITLNGGNASEWSEKQPLAEWIPIGSSKTKFAGFFDGQGHTISGLYRAKQDTTSEQIGLFGYTNKNCTIYNLKVENSYFSYLEERDAVRIGGIVGIGNGRFDTIYADVIIESTGIGNGGIVGATENAKIRNCWYAGKMNLLRNGSTYAGGILGFISTGKASISHCLNEGEIYSISDKNQGPRIGGIIGSVDGGNTTSVEMEDCLSVGAITTEGATSQVASLVGRQTAPNKVSTPLVIRNSYATLESNASFYQNTGSITVEDSVQFKESDIKGIKGYQRMLLDFEGHWAAVNGTTPVLRSFIDRSLALNTDGVIRVIAADTSWVNKAEGTVADPYILSSEADLYGLAKLVNQGNSFANKVIKLARNMKLNVGTSAEWKVEAPVNVWTPIGKSTANAFAGTFDGQGHTIEGMYHDSEEKGGYIGLFGYTAQTSVIKNLQVKNTYFTYSGTKDNARIGGVVAYGKGMIDTVFCEATLESSALGTGGLAGCKDGTLTIQNSWFAGTINLKPCTAVSNQSWAGGFVGFSAGGETNLKNCLFTGTIDTTGIAGQAPRIGGFVGSAHGSGTVNINSCLSEGTITTDGATANIASVIGCKVNGVANIRNTYAISKLYEGNSLGNDKVEFSRVISKNDILGKEGYIRTSLEFDDLETKENFDGVWVARNGKTPALRSFVPKSEVINLFSADTTVVADRSWYDNAVTDSNGNAPGSANNPYILSDAADLLGFSQISQTYNFSGKYIKLDRNIMFNTSDSSIWGEAAPKNSWTPATPYAYRFAGVFDGNGYTISGLYTSTKGTAIYLGLMQCTDASGQVKNLSIKNSYFANVGSGTNNNYMNEAVSSFVGSARGTLTNLYSNATLKSSVLCTGGIAGEAWNAITIRNCWFAGEIVTEGKNSYSDQVWAGGILGNVRSVNMTITIEYCLNTGTHATTSTAADPRIGGIVGSKLSNATVNVNHCVSTGEIVKGSTTGVIGSIVGTIVGAKTNLTNCYGTFTPLHNNPAGTITSSGILDENAVLNESYWMNITSGSPRLKAFW